MTKPTLSVVTTCSEAVSKEYYLKELIESVWEIADEIIVINGDFNYTGETWKLLVDNWPDKATGLHPKLKMYNNPWQKRMGCMMGRLQRSLAISHATQDYIMLLDNDDEFSTSACFEITKLLNQDRNLDFIYTDEDKIDKNGNHSYSFFKPDWSPDIMHSVNYAIH